MSRYFKLKGSRGITILEMMVTVSIVSVILTVILFNQSTYTDTAALYNVADDISITISQAQAYGIGVREAVPGTNEFNRSYGVSLSLRPHPDGSPTAYIFFVDRDDDDKYDNDWSCPIGGASECLARTDIFRGNVISDICIMRVGSNVCDPVSGVDIIFTRPEIEAKLTFFNNGGNEIVPGYVVLGARINLLSPKGSVRSVDVYKTGQISIQ